MCLDTWVSSTTYSSRNGPEKHGNLLSPDNCVCVCVWCVVVQLEVFPDEEVRVVNANQVPDDDYASVFDGVAGALLYVC